jgi:hypothetical protein
MLRLRARLDWRRLNARLAAGADPSGDAELALHASRLASQSRRRRIAGAVERVCRRPDPAARLSAIPVHAAAVDVARPALLQLAMALRSRESVSARGVALTQLLLTEPGGPLYQSEHPSSLHDAAREALLALVPNEDPDPIDRGV